MNYGLERIWKETVEALMRYYPGICLKELSGTTKTSARIANDSFQI
jgi:hypothetical protein